MSHTELAGVESPTSRAHNNGARRSAHPGLLLLLIAGAQLMVVLDATIVNIALPSMARHFDRSQTDMTWAINAYTLAFGGLLLLGGRAGDILGRRQMFVLGLGLFSFGSLLGGLAPSFQLLLVGRVIQGVGGAIAAPTALSLITTSFAEGRERNRAFAVYASVSAAGAAIGLLAGGILTEYLNWRWVLFVNVPIGVALMAGGYFYIQSSERLSGKFDFLGAALSVAGMVSLVYGFINAAHHSWGNATTIACLTAAALLLGTFVAWESQSPNAMMPLRIFSNRSRSGAYIVMLALGAAMFGMFYFLTFFVQTVMHFSALKAGVSFLPFCFVIVIGSGIVSQLLPRIGPKLPISIGVGLATVALFLFSTVQADSGYWSLIFPAQVLMATGMSMVFVPLTSVAVSKVAPTDAGLASALLNVGQQVGGSIGLSVLATVAATSAKHATRHELPKLSGETQKHFAELAASSVTGRPPSAAALSDPAAQHAFNVVSAHSSGMGFFTAAIFGIVAFVVAVFMINIRRSDVSAQPAEVVAA